MGAPGTNPLVSMLPIVAMLGILRAGGAYAAHQPELAGAIVASPARRLVTLNLAADNETLGLSVADHLAALWEGREGDGDHYDRLYRLEDRLRRTLESQKEFIDDASHELLTPLTIIRGHLELRWEDPSEREGAVEVVTEVEDPSSLPQREQFEVEGVPGLLTLLGGCLDEHLTTEPPTILTEAIAQVGAILILAKPENRQRLPFFAGIERVRYRRAVHPGDVVEIDRGAHPTIMAYRARHVEGGGARPRQAEGDASGGTSRPRSRFRALSGRAAPRRRHGGHRVGARAGRRTRGPSRDPPRRTRRCTPSGQPWPSPWPRTSPRWGT